MKIIEITEDKFDKMSESAEKMLSAGGELMSCIDELRGKRGGDMQHRYPNVYPQQQYPPQQPYHPQQTYPPMGDFRMGYRDDSGGNMNQRGDIGYRDGGNMGYREDEMNQRRGVPGTGARYY